MYNGTITGGAINTGVPAAVIVLAGAGHGTSLGGAALVALAAANLLLLARAARQRTRTFTKTA